MFRTRRPRGRRPQRPRSERGGGPQLRLAPLLALLAGVGWAWVPVGALTTHVPPADRPAAASGLPWLSTSGGRIVDDRGAAVLLHGFNSDALLEDGTRHAELDESDATMMQSAGFDVVRLPIAWSLLEPQRGHFDATYLDRIVDTVAMLNRHGLYAVLNMHIRDWSPRFGGSGAPDWAALPLVPDLQWWPWESWRRHLSPAVNAATTYFWLSPDWQADFIDAWRAVAGRLRGVSGVAGYDLFNEPHPLPIPPRLFEQHWMWPLYARTIDAVGSADPNHLFIVEGTFFGDYGTTVVPLSAPNLVYSPHLYTGALIPPAFDGNRGPVDDRIAGQASEAAALPAAMWSGELGIDHHQARATEWADAALDAYDDLGAGWAWWQWRESPSWGIRDAAGSAVDTPFLRHLARPYLVSAPAGVRAGRGDGVRGTLGVVVNAGPARSVEISWPELTLGTPLVQGSCVATSSWDASRARVDVWLAAGPGCTVSVTRSTTSA